MRARVKACAQVNPIYNYLIDIGRRQTFCSRIDNAKDSALAS